MQDSVETKLTPDDAARLSEIESRDSSDEFLDQPTKEPTYSVVVSDGLELVAYPPEENMFLLKEIIERLGVGQSTLYDYLKELNIQPWRKNVKGRQTAYLDDWQIAWLEYYTHWLKTNSKSQWDESPNYSGLWTTKKWANRQVRAGKALAVVDRGEIATDQVETVDTEFDQGDRQYGDSTMDKLVRAAQTRAAGLVIAEMQLAREFADNPDNLPADLKRIVTEAEDRFGPKSHNPNTLATDLMSKFRARQKQSGQPQPAA